MAELQIQRINEAITNHNSKQAENAISFISNTFSEYVSPDLIDEYINILFENDMIFNCMHKSAKLKPFQHFVSECFQLLYVMVENLSQQVEKYIPKIVQISLFFLRSNSVHSNLRHHAGVLIKLILQKNVGVNDEMLVSLLNAVQELCIAYKSTSPTLTAITFPIWGWFSKNNPQILNNFELIVNTCIAYLQTGDDSQPVLQGGYECLSYLLQNTSNTLSEQQICNIYEMLKKHVEFTDNRRKQGAKEAVVFFAHNAAFFGNFLITDYGFWRSSLNTWLISGNLDYSKSGYFAVNTFHKVLSDVILKKNDPSNYAILRTMIEYFQNVLDYEVPDDKVMKISIKGIGFLACCCKEFLEDDEFHDLFIYVVQKLEYFHANNEIAEKHLEKLPDFIATLTKFLEQLDEINYNQITALKKAIVLLIKLYPNLRDIFHDLVTKSLIITFKCVANCKTFKLEDFLQDVIRQGLLWTCSHNIVQDVELLNLGEISYKHYLPIWNAFLSQNMPENISKCIVNELMKSWIYMSNKLNLEIKISENDFKEEATKIDDIVIFANLSDLYCDLLNGFPIEEFKRWFNSLADHIMKRSLKVPLISGFYKILAKCLNISNSINYFSKKRLAKEAVNTLFLSLKDFLAKLNAKINDFKGDLLYSAVKLYLCAPISLIRDLNCSEIYKKAFKLGQSNFEIAQHSLESLKNFFKELPANETMPVLKFVVPEFDAYLRSEFSLGDTFVVEGRKRKVYSKRTINVDVEPELLALQSKMLQFLAGTNSEICMELVSATSEIKTSGNREDILKVVLPYSGESVALHLDKFLDRISFLALNCADRKIKITACELLHSVVMIFLGISVRLGQASSDAEEILGRLFNSILDLGCDSDETVQQLFHPLGLQLVHFYSNPKQRASTFTQIILESTLVGTTNVNNASKRDYSGLLIKEFLLWTVKQTREKQMKDALFSIDFIMENLQHFCLHPDPWKQRGGTVIFNNIYSELREKDIFLNKYYLQILYAFVMSLQQIDNFDFNHDHLQQVNTCLDRVTRVFKEKRSVFERAASEDCRPTPAKFQGNTMKDVELFLLQNCSSKNMHCRAKCLEMFEKLVSKDFDVQDHIKIEHFLPQDLTFECCKTIKEILKYYYNLLCLIDGQIFVLKQQQSVNISSWNLLKHFMQNLAAKSLEDILNHLNLDKEVFVRGTKEEFAYIKYKIVESLLKMIEWLIKYKKDLLSNEIYEFLINCTFNSIIFGIVLCAKQTDTYAKIHEALFANLTAEETSIYKKLVDAFLNNQQLKIKDDCCNVVSLKDRQILQGIILLQKWNVRFLSTRKFNIFRHIKGILIDDNSGTVKKMHSTYEQYLELIMQIEFCFNESTYGELLPCILDYTPVECIEEKVAETFGVFLFVKFKKTLLDCIQKASKMSEFLKDLQSNCLFKHFYEFYIEVTVYLRNEQKQELAQTIYEVTNYLWSEFEENLDFDQCLSVIDNISTISGSAEKLNIEQFLIAKIHSLNNQEKDVHVLCQIVLLLGNVAKSGIDSNIENAFNDFKDKFQDVLQKESTRILNTILVKNLFAASFKSKSIDLFIQALNFEVNYPHNFQIESDFYRIHTKNLNDMLLTSLLNKIKQHPFGNLTKSTQHLCLLLSHCKYNLFEIFFVQHITEIMQKFKSKDLELQKESCLLIECLFGRINVENFESKSCPITEKFSTNVTTGKELLKAVMGQLLDSVKEEPLAEYDSEKFRIYKCFAYNALVTVVCNCKLSAKFYEPLLNRFNSQNEDILWSGLVPTNAAYNIGIIVSKLPEKRKLFLRIKSQSTNVEEKEYIQSQHLFNSTLMEDVCKYDMTNASIRTLDNSESHENSSGLLLEMDLDEINKHECMLHICGLIKHMHEQELLPFEVPRWIISMNQMLQNQTVHLNIKYFLCKILENNQEYLKAYSDLLLPTVVDVICDCFSEINGLVIDLLVMFLTSWKDTKLSRDQASKLVKFSMENVYNDRLDVCKYNLRLLRELIEHYEEFEIAFDLIEKYFENSDLNSKQSLTGIHIVNILLVNNRKPYRNDLKSFAKKMILQINNTNRAVYQACAETIGLLMKYLDEQNDSDLNNLVKLTHSKLTTLSNNNPNNFTYILDGIVKHYPEFGEKFLSKIAYLLTSVSPNFVVLFLRILIKCIHHVTCEDMLRRFDLKSYFAYSDLNVQVVSLELTLQLVPHLSVAKLDEEIMPKVIEFNCSTNVVVRSLMYDILIGVFRKYCESEDETCITLLDKMRVVLIRGFVDSEPEIREKIYNFWSNFKQFTSEKLQNKILFLKENFYSAENEDLYLSVCNTLLLQELIANDYEEPIFSHPLYECEFTDYEVTARWRAQYSSMIPLLASTMSSQGNFFLRATQSFREFQPTVATQDLASQKTQFLETPSLDLPQLRTEFKDPNKIGISNEYKIRKQRFYKESHDIKLGFIKRELKKSENIQMMRVESKKQKESEVKIYRKYRFGDYPDIQINLSSVLKPLLELAKKDVMVSQQLYMSLFESLNIGDKIQKIAESIETIFNATVMFNIPLMKTLLQIALKYKNDIKFNPGTIVSISKNSGNLSLGCLLLEEYILQGFDSEEPSTSKKGIGASQNEETTHWVKLAELYKSLEEWDIVYTIFNNKLICPEDAAKAIEAESNMEWRRAHQLYAKVLMEDYDLERKDFFCEAFFKCCSELSDWKAVEQQILNTMNDPDNIWDELWSSEWNRNKLLPFYLNAQIKNALNDSNPDEQIENVCRKISEFSLDSNKKTFLNNNFAEELAFLGVLTYDVDMAQKYLKIFETNFLTDWRNFNTLFVSLRSNCLLSMRNALNIGTFLNDLKAIDKNNYTEIVTNILSQWEKIFEGKEQSKSTVQVETYKLYQSQFIKLLKFKIFEDLEVPEDRYVQTALNNMNCTLDVNLVDFAVQKSNFNVAKKYLTLHAKEIKDATHPQFAFINLLMSKLLLLRMQQSPNSKLLVEAFKHLDLSFQNVSQENIKVFLASVDQINKLCDAVYEYSLKESINIKDFQTFVKSTQLREPKDLKVYGTDFVYQQLCRIDKEKLKYKKNEVLIGQSFCRMAKYTLKNKDDGEKLIEFTMKAMKYDSQEAILLFPYLLTLDGISNVYKDVFTTLSQQVAIWKFIKWIPQLLAYLDTEKLSAISFIVLKLAEKYPNSLIYSYKLSRSNYNLQNSDLIQLVERLDQLLYNPLVEKMLQGLKFLCAPDVIIRNALEKLKKSTLSLEAFKRIGQQIENDLFSSALKCGGYDSPRGSAHKYVDQQKSKLMKIIKSKATLEKIKEEISNFELSNYKDPVDLGAYSPWLKNFHASEYDTEIELPGQYTGYTRPLVHYNKKIAAFSSDVSLFHSKRKPILLTIIGSDVKEYPFIVKCGEDLRQDERIIQLFETMNGILTTDDKCFQRNYEVTTYKIIPLSSELGIIEYVKNTDIVKNIIKKFGNNKSWITKMQQIHKTYCDWIDKASARRKSSINSYASASLKYKRQDVITQYKTISSTIPWDMLKKTFWNMFIDAENYFAFRHNFVRNYSVMCICNWILGIGDRHLENFLIHAKHGKVIGIDFGIAFGAGTQEQLVPEMVPFRLTPQIVNLMKPFNEEGLFQETMTHTLKALSMNSDLLLASLNIFILEPTLDWLGYIENPSGWKPEIILSIAKKKLSDVNCSLITIEEIENRTKDTQEVNNVYVEIAKGAAPDNIRASFGTIVSPAEQVKCLIDQATDPNLLGRMWHGWEPWI